MPKSTNPSRLKENIEIFDFELTPAHRQTMDALNCDERLNTIPG